MDRAAGERPHFISEGRALAGSNPPLPRPLRARSSRRGENCGSCQEARILPPAEGPHPLDSSRPPPLRGGGGELRLGDRGRVSKARTPRLPRHSPAPDLSAKADIAGSQPRIHSPGLDTGLAPLHPPLPRTPPREPRPWPRHSPVPDPSAKADIAGSLPRIHFIRRGRMRAGVHPIRPRPESASIPSTSPTRGADSPLPPPWQISRPPQRIHRRAPFRAAYEARDVKTRPMMMYDTNSTPPTISRPRARRICRRPMGSK